MYLACPQLSHLSVGPVARRRPSLKATIGWSVKLEGTVAAITTTSLCLWGASQTMPRRAGVA